MEPPPGRLRRVGLLLAAALLLLGQTGAGQRLLGLDRCGEIALAILLCAAVLWISEWPRSLVYQGFLAPVLLSSGVRRTFTLLYTPMRTDQAARDIRKKKTEYISDAAQRQRIGQIEDAQQSAEFNDVLQQEADLTAGHGILRATGLIAVSARDPDELERAVADIEQAAIQASCETRRLWGQQAQSFCAAALPLCRRI